MGGRVSWASGQSSRGRLTGRTGTGHLSPKVESAANPADGNDLLSSRVGRSGPRLGNDHHFIQLPYFHISLLRRVRYVAKVLEVQVDDKDRKRYSRGLNLRSSTPRIV